MRIAFYAPLKSPNHPNPSGDRRVARLLMQALAKAGFDVQLASELRVRAKPETQREMHDQALQEARRLLAQYRTDSQSMPDAWVTYHHYYKAVDWLGFEVSRELKIPYYLIEASHAPKRSQGDWAYSHQGAERIIAKAKKIFCFNPADKECLQQIVPEEKLVDIKPFLDIASFAPHLEHKESARLALAKSYDVNPEFPWILAVGMMRQGDKLQSYRLLAKTLKDPAIGKHRPLLLAIGNGEARAEVENAFQSLPVFYPGIIAQDRLPVFLRAADCMMWPAINEAFCMALLEAQVCGLPVIAGAYGGVSGIVEDNRTGFLSPPGDDAGLIASLDRLLSDPLLRERLGKEARIKSLQEHDLPNAALILKREIGL